MRSADVPAGDGAPALDHVQVAAPAGCEPAAREFYGTLLGLPELTKPASLLGRGGVWFAAGGGQLHVGVDERFAPAHKAHPALRVPDRDRLAGLARRLADAGCPVTWDDELPGVLRFFTTDPWGNRVELLTPDAD
jgi:hypothetical protein